MCSTEVGAGGQYRGRGRRLRGGEGGALRGQCPDQFAEPTPYKNRCERVYIRQAAVALVHASQPGCCAAAADITCPLLSKPPSLSLQAAGTHTGCAPAGGVAP
jgi:hypothetical protein